MYAAILYWQEILFWKVSESFSLFKNLALKVRVIFGQIVKVTYWQ